MSKSMSEEEIKKRIDLLNKLVNGPSGSFGARYINRELLERSQRWLDEIAGLNALLKSNEAANNEN